MNSRLTALLGAPIALCLASTAARADVVFDFTSSDAGWTPTHESGTAAVLDQGPFTWGSVGSGNAWFANGSSLGSSIELLASPVINITSTTTYSLSFQHRYNFEVEPGGSPTFAFDGGIVQYRVNGGSWQTLSKGAFTAETYSFDSVDAFDGGNPPLQPGFGGESAGNGLGSFITSTAGFGSLASGSTLEIQFRGGWDVSNSNPTPNWVIAGVSVTGAPVPEPAFFASLAGLGLIGYAAVRRARAAQR